MSPVLSLALASAARASVGLDKGRLYFNLPSCKPDTIAPLLFFFGVKIRPAMSELQKKFFLVAAVSNVPDATRNVIPLSSCHVPISLPGRENQIKKPMGLILTPKIGL